MSPERIRKECAPQRLRKNPARPPQESRKNPARLRQGPAQFRKTPSPPPQTRQNPATLLVVRRSSAKVQGSTVGPSPPVFNPCLRQSTVHAKALATSTQPQSFPQVLVVATRLDLSLALVARPPGRPGRQLAFALAAHSPQCSVGCRRRPAARHRASLAGRPQSQCSGSRFAGNRLLIPTPRSRKAGPT